MVYKCKLNIRKLSQETQRNSFKNTQVHVDCTTDYCSSVSHSVITARRICLHHFASKPLKKKERSSLHYLLAVCYTMRYIMTNTCKHSNVEVFVFVEVEECSYLRCKDERDKIFSSSKYYKLHNSRVLAVFHEQSVTDPFAFSKNE